MVKFLLGVAGALGFSKWVESKNINPVITIGSELLLCFLLMKFIRR